MNAAFSSVVPTPVQAPAPTQVSAAPTYAPRGPYRNQQRPAYTPTQDYEDYQEGGEGSEYTDRVAAEQLAKELAASVRGQISVNLDAKPKSIRFEDLPVAQQFKANPKGTKTKRSRK
jgi:hypothetical protein